MLYTEVQGVREQSGLWGVLFHDNTCTQIFVFVHPLLFVTREDIAIPLLNGDEHGRCAPQLTHVTIPY